MKLHWLLRRNAKKRRLTLRIYFWLLAWQRSFLPEVVTGDERSIFHYTREYESERSEGFSLTVRRNILTNCTSACDKSRRESHTTSYWNPWKKLQKPVTQINVYAERKRPWIGMSDAKYYCCITTLRRMLQWGTLPMQPRHRSTLLLLISVEAA